MENPPISVSDFRRSVGCGGLGRGPEAARVQPDVKKLSGIMLPQEFARLSNVPMPGGRAKRQRDRAEVEREQAAALTGVEVVLPPRLGAGDDRNFVLRESEFQISFADVLALRFWIGQKDLAGARFQQQIAVRRVRYFGERLRRQCDAGVAFAECADRVI